MGDGKSDFSLELTEEEVDNYVEASYIVFRKTEDGFYESLYSGTDVDLDGNTLKAKVRDKGVQVLSSNDETGNISLLEQERTDEYTNYFSPVMLTYFSDDADDFEMDAISGYLQIRVYHDGEIEVMGIVPNEELTKELDDNSTIEFCDLTTREGNRSHISGLTYILLYSNDTMFIFSFRRVN